LRASSPAPTIWPTGCPRIISAAGAVARGVLLALAGLAAVILWRRRRAGGRRLLWPPPVEVIYQAPVALGLIVVAEAGNPLAAAAVLRLSLGALVIAPYLSEPWS